METTRELLSWQRMRLSPDELIALVQHEAANALQRILNNTSRLRHSGDYSLDGCEEEDWRLSLRSIEIEVHDLGRLLNLLPSLSTGDRIDTEPVLLQRVVPEVVLERWRGDDVHVAITHLPEDLPPVVANRDMLRIVLHNLLSNAEKYAPPHQAVEIDVCRSGGSLLLRVRDHGPGLRAEDLELIFQFFFRGGANRARPAGMGVGLALCRLLMTSMGGRISAELPVGPGLCMTVELPVAREETY